MEASTDDDTVPTRKRSRPCAGTRCAATYVIHIPLIVVIAYLLRGITIAPLAKFGLASLVAVPVCFAVAYIVRKIPFVSKVL